MCCSSGPGQGHVEPIVALDVFPQLRLFASCGMDCTVRVWSEENNPIRCVARMSPCLLS